LLQITHFLLATILIFLAISIPIESLALIMLSQDEIEKFAANPAAKGYSAPYNFDSELTRHASDSRNKSTISWRTFDG
jgi:hypothetical protein